MIVKKQGNNPWKVRREKKREIEQEINEGVRERKRSLSLLCVLFIVNSTVEMKRGDVVTLRDTSH